MPLLDVIVIGLGAMGSAAAYRLARGGARVLGLEQFSRGHELGSSHGQSRLVRRAYLTRPHFIPLLHRAYQLWADLERESGERVFQRTGVLVVASGGQRPAEGAARELALAHGVKVDDYDDSRRDCFGLLSLPQGSRGYFEADAGYVTSGRVLEAQCCLAERHGARLRFREPVCDFRCHADHVEVVTHASTYRADSVVITAGPWSQSLLADLGLSFVIRRIPQLWFRLQPSAGSRANTPCFSVKLPYGEFYGVPTLDGSLMKVCGGAERAVVKHATHLDRQLRPEDTREVGRFIRECLPGVESQPSDYSMCMATMTPDESFVVDRHPRSPRIVFAAGFSGHGFKFTPAIGELVADMVTWNAASSPNFMCLRPQLEAAQSTLLQ